MSTQRNIIHVCNNYISSKVHARLLASIDAQFEDILQELYVPVRRSSDVGVNEFFSTRLAVVYDYCLPVFLRYFPLLKVLWVSLRFYIKMYRFKTGKIVAHSLWSDGFPAFLCTRIFGGRYSVFVRGTDLNFFIPNLPHYRFLFRSILKYADDVFFVSPAYEMESKKKYPYIFSVVRNSVVLPNGVDAIWLNNILRKEVSRKDLLFVGRFDKNKNLDMVLRVFVEFSKLNSEHKLRLVGGDAGELKNLLGLQAIPPRVEVLGVIKDFEVLKELYRSSAVLLVPSKSETFGLVYIEALSQGCPIVHTKGQGVSGYFDGCDYVFQANCTDVDDLLSGVCFLAENYPTGVPANFFEKKLEIFSWESIARKFVFSLFGARL